MIVDGFDLDSALVCEGIVGDGCGGGRIFYIQDKKLFAYDPHAKAKIQIQGEIKDALRISKKACVITIECKNKIINIDLSKLSQ